MKRAANRSASRHRLRPSQIRHVAGRRFDDAQRLLAAGRRHANGAIYLAGIAVECYLKAELLSAYPSLASTPPSKLKGTDLHRWELLFRWHDLLGLVEALPRTLEVLQNNLGSVGAAAVRSLKMIAAQWSIMIRYDSRDMDLADAQHMLSLAEDVHRCLANRS